MLLAAFVDPSEREVGVASQMVDAGALKQKAGLDRCGFGVLEDFQGSLLTVGDAQPLCNADERDAALLGAGRYSQSRLKGGN